MKKVLIAIVAIIAIAIAALAIFDIGGGFISQKASEFVRNNYDLDLRMAKIKGNPIRGYNLNEVTVDQQNQNLIAADSIKVDTSIMALLGGNLPLKSVTLSGISTDVDNIQRLVNTFTGQDLSPEIRHYLQTLVEGKINLDNLKISFRGDDYRLEGLITIDSLPIEVDGTVTLKDNSKNISLKNATVKVAQGTIKADGKVMPDMNLKASISDLNLGIVGENILLLKGYGISGKLSANATANGQVTNPDVNGSYELESGMLAGIPLSSKGTINFKNMLLDAKPLDIVVLGVPVTGEASVDFGQTDPYVKVKATSNRIDIAEMRKSFPNLDASISGGVDLVNIDIAGPLSKLGGSGELKANLISIGTQKIENTQIKGTFDSNGVMHVDGSSSIMGKPATLKGTIKQDPKGFLWDLSGNLRNFDVAALRSISDQVPQELYGIVNLAITIKGYANNLSVNGTFSSDKMGYRPYEITSVTVPFNYTPSALKINDGKGRFLGALVNLSGSVAPANLDGVLGVKATITDLDAASAVKLLGLTTNIKGKVSATANVTGKASEPQVKVTANSQSLTLENAVVLQKTSVDSDIALSAKGLGNVGINGAIDKISAFGVSIDNTKSHLTWDGKALKIDSLSANVGTGAITGKGTVTVDKDVLLDISASLANGDVGALLSSLKLDMPMSGLVDANLAVKGTASAPNVTLNATSPKAVVAGVGLSNFKANLTTGANGTYNLNTLEASVGDGKASATGVFKSGNTFTSDINVTVDKVDLAKAFASYPEIASMGLKGVLNGNFKGTFAGANGKGDGKVNIAGFELAGLKFDNPNANLTLNGMNLSVSNLNSGFYNGKITGNAGLNLDKLSFNTNVNLDGSDLPAIIKAFAPDLGAALTGTIKGQYSGSGTLSPFSLKGSGNVSSAGGALTGFPLITPVLAIYGERQLTYASANIPFTTNTNNIAINNGIIKSHDNDKLYRYISADGTVGFDKKLNLTVKANMNIMLVNAVAGAGAGGLAGAAGGVAGILTGITAGATTAAEKQDFREISFHIGGTTDKVSFSNLTVSKGQEGTGTTGTQSPTNLKDVGNQLLNEIIPGRQPTQQEGTEVTEPTKSTTPNLRDVGNQLLQNLGGREESKPTTTPAPTNNRPTTPTTRPTTPTTRPTTTPQNNNTQQNNSGNDSLQQLGEGLLKNILGR